MTRTVARRSCLTGETVEEQPDFTVQEVARLTQKTIGTIYRLCHQGQIKSYRVGRSIRIRREDVEAIRQGVA